MFFPSISLFIGNYLFLSHLNRFFCFFPPDLQRPSFLLSQHHAFGKTPAYPWLPGLPQRCNDLTCLLPVCTQQPQGTHLTHRGCQALQRACTKRQIIPFCFLSLHSRGSESAFGFVWAKVSEHYQAVFPEGRWDSGDV